MAKLNPSRNLCARCHLAVKPGSDFLRAHFWGRTVYWHWKCFLIEMQRHTSTKGYKAAQPATV